MVKPRLNSNREATNLKPTNQPTNTEAATLK